MKNLIFFVLCVLLYVSICVYGDSNFIKTEKQAKSATQAVSVKLDNVKNYSIKNLSNNEVEYLKQSSPYKDLYNDKKLVIYFVGADCPYAKTFTNAIEPLMNNPEYYSKYNFYPEEASGIVRYNTMEEAKAATSFGNKCQSFCVVNPTKSQIFALDGVGDKEAQQIGLILSQLKDW